MTHILFFIIEVLSGNFLHDPSHNPPLLLPLPLLSSCSPMLNTNISSKLLVNCFQFVSIGCWLRATLMERLRAGDTLSLTTWSSCNGRGCQWLCYSSCVMNNRKAWRGIMLLMCLASKHMLRQGTGIGTGIGSTMRACKCQCNTSFFPPLHSSWLNVKFFCHSFFIKNYGNVLQKRNKSNSVETIICE